MKVLRLNPDVPDLTAALQGVRRARVELTDGIYFLHAPVRLGDGVTLAAAPGAKPVISGGVRLTGWRVENGRWTLPVDWSFTQLFVNGERRPRTRWPKTGFFRFEALPDGRSTTWYKGAMRAVYAPGDCMRWRHLDEVRVIALQSWFEQHLRIATLDEATRTITFVKRALSDLHDENGQCARYYVENAIETLTEPGEWCLCGGILHYLPRPGETPETTEVIAPRLTTLARLEDCREARLEGLTFQHADWELPAQNVGAVQAAINVPGTIQLRGAVDCEIAGCTVSQVAGYAIEVQVGSVRNRIVNCHLHDLGAGGVKVNHERALGTRCTEDEAFAGMDVVEYGWAGRETTEPAQTEIARCRIHDGGKIFHSAVGVWIGDSGFNHVHHNEIFDLYYTGISCGWSWSYAPTRCIANVIEYNHVYNIGRKLLSDMGAIYLLGYQPGGIVRGNHVHDVSCHGYGGSGIYPDQGSSFIVIEDNVVHHTQTDALSIHYGSGLTVRHNVFALTQSSLLARGREESGLTAVVEHNLFYGASPPMLGYFWSNPRTMIFRHNRYWVQGGQPPEFAGMTFAEWQALGQDAGSVVDPSVAEEYKRRVAAILNEPVVSARRYPALEPRLEIGPPTFPTAADHERLTSLPSVVFVTAGQPQRLSLTLTNRDQVRWQGRGQFQVTGGASLTGAVEFNFDLKPGAHAVFAVDAILSPATDAAVVTVESAAFPVVGQLLTLRRDLVIRRGVPLEQQPARELSVGGRVVGRLQMAVDHERLHMRMTVCDAEVKPNPEQPWAGSGIELFCESANTHHKTQQFFLYPGGAARHDHDNAKVVSEPAIHTTHDRTSDGYVLTAQIPLSLLGMTPASTEFHLEMFVATHTAPGKRVQAKLFGACYSWMGMDGWGTVRVVD